MVLSNRTGVPLQLLQLRPGAFEETVGGVMPVPATHSGLPRVGGPRAGGSAGAALGLRTALSDASSAIDWTACMDLPPGEPYNKSIFEKPFLHQECQQQTRHKENRKNRKGGFPVLPYMSHTPGHTPERI